MVRAPCCEKMGLKRGPWSPEEDHILISYIQRHGHGNWRALPKRAGLLRCGKSCRLRWINYLRPDIKRGNFSLEEEETIIKLHEMLGNRWSAIAARLPGRTDNEIKNVWHTHLKKRLAKRSNHEDVVEETQKRQPKEEPEDDNNVVNVEERPVSSAQSSSNSDDNNNNNDDGDHHHHIEVNNESASKENELDDDFWLEVFSSSNDSPGPQIKSPLLEGIDVGYEFVDLAPGFSSNMYNNDNDIDLWYEVFPKGGGLPELLAQM